MYRFRCKAETCLFKDGWCRPINRPCTSRVFSKKNVARISIQMFCGIILELFLVRKELDVVGGLFLALELNYSLISAVIHGLAAMTLIQVHS